MVHREPGTDGCELTFKRPDWLWPVPFGGFDAYAPGLPSGTPNMIWYTLPPEGTWHRDSLYGIHCKALEGDTFALDTMHMFYEALQIALVTHRLTS